MDRLFIRACTHAVRSPVGQVSRGRSVGIKRSGQEGERRMVEAYSVVQPIFLVSIPRHSFGRSSLSLLFFSFSTLRRRAAADHRFLARQYQTARRCSLPVYRNAGKKVHAAPGFCCSSFYDATDATEIVNEALGAIERVMVPL